MGFAPFRFCYEHLNNAFQILLEHPENLIAVHRGNCLRDEQGKLILGPGPFVAAFETASGCSPAKIMGKPSVEIFESALHSMNPYENALGDSNDNHYEKVCSSNRGKIQIEQLCMIGDDILADCKGALDAGIGAAILVQTGKYHSGYENKLHLESSSHTINSPDGKLIVRPSIVEAIDYVLESI